MTPKDPITLAIEALEYYSGQETYGFLHETDRAIQPLAALRTLQARPVPSAMPPDAMRSIAQIAFETHASFFDFSHPRMGMRTATWDELPEKSKQEWEEVARTVLASATASPDGYKSFDDLENERKAYRMGWDDGIASVGGDESPKTSAGDVEPDWWWFADDPDEAGDSPHEVMYPHRHRLKPVELRSSYVGPNKWGVMCPPMPEAEDNSETAHTFDTEDEAQKFCAARREALAAARSKIGDVS